MKKSFSCKILATFMAAVMLFVFGACNNNEKKDATVILDQETLTVEEFESAVLTATVTNAELSDIVWTSSDTSKVTVDGGTVYGKSAGTATVTATVGNASAGCEVTVTTALQQPELSVSPLEGPIKVGESVPVIAVVKFKNVEIEETPISWVSADPSVATFADNKITAVKRGNTVMTVSAEYLGKQLSKTISITVEDNVRMALDVPSVRLALSNPDGNHITSKTLISEVYEDNVQITNPEIVWSSANESIAVVAAGVITPVGAGTTTVTAEYMTTKGYPITAQAEVTVYLPVVNGKGSVEFELTGTNKNLNLSEYGLTVEGSGDVDVYDTGTEQKITATLSDNILTLTVADIHWGLRELEIRKPDVICSINIVAITKIITTADELLQIQTYGGIQATASTMYADSDSDGINDYNYSGYFVLGNDIDLTGKTITSLYWTETNSTGTATKDTFFSKTTASSDGFSGTFDGRGHTISGGTYSKGGLFGTVSENGTVKNVAIVGANITYSNISLGSYVVISGFFSGTLKDVLIDGIVDDTTPTDGKGANVNSGGFMVFDARYASIENVVIYYWNKVSPTATSPICRGVTPGKVPACTNVYVFTDHQNLVGGNTATWAGVTKYTYDTVLTDSGVSVQGLTATFWDLSGDKVSFN